VPSRRAGSGERGYRGRCGTAIAGQELRLRLFHRNARIRQLPPSPSRGLLDSRKRVAPRAGQRPTG
jgi:hypothetical protein